MARLQLVDACVEFSIPMRIKDLALDKGRRMLGAPIDRVRRSILALENINLDVKAGDRLGIIGHNGAGKTTLLRVLAGIYEPTRGSALIEGRTTTLITAAPGIDLDDTGLENITSCGLYHGMTRREIAAKIDDIAAFTDLGDYLEMPARIYSAGMLTRLSFAIATAIDPEILILDEGLAAGDAAFVMKAERRITQLIDRATIVVVASHSAAMLTSMCTHGIALQHGRVVASGAMKDVVAAYFDSVVEGARQGNEQHLTTAFAVAQDLARHGESVPPAIEEQALIAALRQVPGDRMMSIRLCQLLRMQGKPIPDALQAFELEPAQASATQPNAD